MTTAPTFDRDGIDLKSRAPVGAMLMAAEKKPGGAIDASTLGSWIIGERYAVGAGKNAVRGRHPDFTMYNGLPAERRKAFHGELVHPNARDACQISRRAWNLPCSPPTADFPACVGDCETATRLVELDGRDPKYDEIECPGERCEFAIGRNSPCRPFAMLYFRPSWEATKGWPRPMMIWQTKSRRNIEVLLGFWNWLADEARALGLLPPGEPFEGDDGRQALANAGVPVIGLPFELTVGFRWGQGDRIPAVTISPLATFADAAKRQRELLEAGGLEAYKLLPGARSPEEHEADLVAADHAAITPTPVRVPGDEDVVEAEVVEADGRGLFDD